MGKAPLGNATTDEHGTMTPGFEGQSKVTGDRPLFSRFRRLQLPRNSVQPAFASTGLSPNRPGIRPPTLSSANPSPKGALDVSVPPRSPGTAAPKPELSSFELTELACHPDMGREKPPGPDAHELCPRTVRSLSLIRPFGQPSPGWRRNREAAIGRRFLGGVWRLLASIQACSFCFGFVPSRSSPLPVF